MPDERPENRADPHTKTVLRAELRIACAIAHGATGKKSLLELVAIVLEDGLPSRVERERIRDQKLQGDDDGKNV